MADYHCPSCRVPIRGALFYKVKRGPRTGLMKSNVFECPNCHVRLLALPNWLQIVGTAIACTSVMVRIYLEHEVGYREISLGLSLLTLGGFLMSGIAMAYFPRYRTLKNSEQGASDDDER